MARLTDPVQKGAAADDLVSRGGPIALALVKEARNALLPAQEAILDVVVRIGPAALPSLAGCSIPMLAVEFSECDFAIRAVVRKNDDVLPPLEEMAGRVYADFGYAASGDFARRALRELGPARALPAMVRLTESRERGVRKEAYSIISSWNDPAVGDVLVPALEDADPGVRYYAFRGLRAIRDRRLLPAALRAIENNKNPGLQEDAAAGLGTFYSPEFRAPLFRVARDANDIGARRTAASWLRRVEDSTANRLGLRYEVSSVSPAMEAAILRRCFLQLVGSAALCLVFLRIANALRFRWLVLPAMAAVGAYWGGGMTYISGTIERVLLLFVVPMVWVIARTMGTRMSGLKDLMIPFVTAFGGGVLWVVLPFLLAWSAFLRNAVLLFGSFLVPVGFLIGVAIVIRRSWKRSREVWAEPHDVAFTRLATVGCAAFYAGYLVAWWRLWDYSLSAFRYLL